MLQVDLTLHLVMVSNLNCLSNIHHKVASTSPSRLEAHAGFFRLPIKGLKDEKSLLTLGFIIDEYTRLFGTQET